MNQFDMFHGKKNNKTFSSTKIYIGIDQLLAKDFKISALINFLIILLI